MAARIKYEVDGIKVPALKTILDNCKIGGIGNLLYRANQAGLSGRQYPNPGEDTTNAGLFAFKSIESLLNRNIVDIDLYSDSCIDRAENAVDLFTSWAKQGINLNLEIKNITLVSESLKYGDTFNIYTYEGGKCLVLPIFHNEVYLDDLIKLAADAILCEENGMHIDRVFILQINNPKTVDDIVTFTEHEYDDMDYALEVFVAMRKLHDMQLTLKTLI